MPEEENDWTSLFYGFLKAIFWVAAAVVVLRIFIVQPLFVDGASMEPTFENNDLVFAEKLSYKFRPARRFEFVIFSSPHNEEDVLIKRIVGLPGERLRIENGSIYVSGPDNSSGVKLEEPYRRKSFSEDLAEVAIGEDELFVIGDNNPASLDSREFGPIKKSEVIGKVFLRIWPIDKFTLFVGL